MLKSLSFVGYLAGLVGHVAFGETVGLVYGLLSDVIGGRGWKTWMIG